MEIGTIYRDLETSDMYVLLGYTVKYHSCCYVLVYLTQFYIGDDFVYNKYFNIDGYFEELKNNLINKPIGKHYEYMSLRNFEVVSSDVYNFDPYLFKSDELKLWYTKSRLAGTIDYDVFFSLEDAENELKHLKQLKEEEKRRDLQRKLEKVELLSEEDVRVGNVYHNPVTDEKYLYLGKNKEDKYAFMLLAEVDYNNLGVKNETKLYQTVLSLLGLKSRLKTYKVVPKLEKESLLFVPLYTYAASVNYKLALKKLGFKIGG